MGMAPRCSGLCFTTRTGRKKRDAPDPHVWRTAHLYEERSAVRQPPYLSPAPQPSRCRDTTSCVGVGRLSTPNRRVKKHRCHNCGAITIRFFNGLSHFLRQERAVNTPLFCQMQESGRTQYFVSTVCPPATHK